MIMQDKDLFIFDFIEGNLSQPQKELAEELYETDSSFKEEVDALKHSYFHKTTAPIPYTSPTSLIPKFNYTRWFILAFALSTITFAYLAYNLNSKQKELKNQISTLSHKNIQTHQDLPSHAPKADTIFIEKTELKYVSNSQEKKSSETNYREQNVQNSFISSIFSDINDESDTLMYKLDSEPIEVETQKSQDPNKTTKEVKKLSFKQKVTRFKWEVIYGRSKQREKIATWPEIKDAFKKQRVVPMD